MDPRIICPEMGGGGGESAISWDIFGLDHLEFPIDFQASNPMVQPPGGPTFTRKHLKGKK